MAFFQSLHRHTLTVSTIGPPPYIVIIAIEVLKLVEQTVLAPANLKYSKLAAEFFTPLAIATTARECEVPIWDGVMVVEGWWSISNFLIGDLEFTGI